MILCLAGTPAELPRLFRHAQLCAYSLYPSGCLSWRLSSGPVHPHRPTERSPGLGLRRIHVRTISLPSNHAKCVFVTR